VSVSSSSSTDAPIATPATSAPRRPLSTVDGLPLETRIPLDPAVPTRGWIMRGRLDPGSGLELSRADGSPLRTLLALRPDAFGKVVMFGKLTDTPRYHLALGRDYAFTGVKHESAAYPPCVKELMDWANARRHEWVAEAPVPAEQRDALPAFNSGLVNWYMDGTHYIGPHADDERNLHRCSPIFSYSVGQTRVFRIRDMRTGRSVRDVDLRSGEWLVMGGAMQQHYKHEVVKVNGAKGARLGPRVNITFRMMI